MTDGALKPDLCVIGAGSGGLSVAAAARAFGASVVLIERDRMGGDCLNVGCVPSKALIAASRHAHAVREAARFGVHAGEPRIDFAAVHAHVHGVIAEIAPHDSVERFEGLGATVIKAEARFLDAETVEAGGRRIKARRFVVATGSRASAPPIPGLADGPFLTNESVFDLQALPARLVVIGGGPIGLELAQAFRRLGAEVAVVEADRALSRDDPELAAPVLAHLRAEGIALHEGAKVTRVEHGEGRVTLHAEAEGRPLAIAGTHLLVAAGRTAVTDGLGLEAAGIAATAKGITVDDRLRTTNRRVFALGDVAGGFQFTHWASYQAGLVIRAALFRLPARVNPSLIAWATYTDPELAQVGLTEREARDKHGDGVGVHVVPLAGNDRARTERRTEGLVKIVTAKRGRIVGAGAVAPHAGDLVAPLALAVSKGLGMRDLAGLVLPYPTYSEAWKRTALDSLKPALDSGLVKGAVRLLGRFG